MSAALTALQERKAQAQVELEAIEDKVYDIETTYLNAEFSQYGTVTKGLEGFLSSKDALRKRQRAFKAEDRLFSLSSVTSPATVELDAALMDQVGDAATGYGRGKGKGKSWAKGLASKGTRR
mmetsp:Transcript_15261/g.46124  ORF Transcript_15261/g.46124 Transcript_15261/m.46124 type:complete len:122 (-) Transcript_15261:252-617(-)|eukprot:CAMPEP_0206143594 /NCGR_PEP_ID=MMETSP1473-20131121/21121_1 /ASSEMBLY_ACC=CAM_ASM_001109 /TAXON_ID=1461547 /ORGANISM="Stichococcus sp, Strain RCC1054" /LENGTH=121 /DNA_ID=CAMNT_0053539071 /DNA_START=248 /DNA_END=613 /DNA_ORIENTATION=-